MFINLLNNNTMIKEILWLLSLPVVIYITYILVLVALKKLKKKE